MSHSDLHFRGQWELSEGHLGQPAENRRSKWKRAGEINYLKVLLKEEIVEKKNL